MVLTYLGQTLVLSDKGPSQLMDQYAKLLQDKIQLDAQETDESSQESDDDNDDDDNDDDDNNDDDDESSTSEVEQDNNEPDASV